MGNSSTKDAIHLFCSKYWLLNSAGFAPATALPDTVKTSVRAAIVFKSLRT